MTRGTWLVIIKTRLVPMKFKWMSFSEIRLPHDPKTKTSKTSLNVFFRNRPDSWPGKPKFLKKFSMSFPGFAFEELIKSLIYFLSILLTASKTGVWQRKISWFDNKEFQYNPHRNVAAALFPFSLWKLLHTDCIVSKCTSNREPSKLE